MNDRIHLEESNIAAVDTALPSIVDRSPKAARSAADAATYGSAGAKPSQLKWFYDSSVRRKQFLALLASEAVSVLGFVGVGSALIVLGGRTQLSNQAEAEAAVTQTNYNIQIDQMASGFRGQSENAAIVELAQAHAEGRSLSAETRQQVREILAHEVEARQIEYATLVGTDLRIIANANADRTGEQFDPEGLVGTVLTNPRQIKTSAIVTWAELAKEAPPLPNGVANQDALIRYTVTPVRNPSTDEVIGVLVSGDIVNGKRPIVEGTLSALQNGYSAVYMRQADGQFRLATSLNAGAPDQAEPNVALADPSVLQRAVNALQPGESIGQPVTWRSTVGEHTYTLAAQAVTNFNGEPVAVLVRGTSEASVNRLLWQSVLVQLALAAAAVAANIGLARLLGRSIANPVDNLRRFTRRVAAGDRQTRAPVFASDEIGELTVAFNELVQNVAASEAKLKEQTRQQELATERAHLLAEVTGKIRRSLDEAEILATSVEGVRKVLQVDRVLVYRFHPDYKSGMIVAEAVGEEWIRALGQAIYDPLTPTAIERFKIGRVTSVENLAEANLSQCHCEILERLEVKANMVAPIIAGEELIGLLCAHQCSAPRSWSDEEIGLMQQLATQVGYALTQAKLLHQQQTAANRERQIIAVVSHLRESLDQEVIFKIVVREVRQALGTDRAIVYMFDDEWVGTVAAESVSDQYPVALNVRIADPCFAKSYVEKYKRGRVQATDDIYNANLTDCHIQQLEPLDIRANLVAPILLKEKLLGLLIVHQCAAPRRWQEDEVNFLRQVAIQLGFALEQAELFNEREQARLEAEALSEEQRQQKEALQLQLLTLLGDVEGAARGDLTVRADVTAGEIGTVADFFNSIIESLRQIVTKVKQSAIEVNASLGDNEGAIRQLAEESLKQAEETTRILSSVEQMTHSIQTVAERARQAAQVARSASATAETGGSAMDLTVENILSLRETVGETAKRVKRLGEASQQISKVVSLINQIALQTNLLAINAGIEAARAGEEGQGFAVVAEEVGELAARSAAATQEIEKIVDNIQQETSQVVEAMEQSTTQVVEGTHLVEDAKRSLAQILDVSRQIDQLVQSISDATVSQVEVSQAVSHLMRDITEVSERTSRSSLKVSQSLRLTVDVAQELQASVGTFNVGSEP
jgi:methyl-accepting chemotaxis protein PixJ